ncbi:MAG: MTH1187 family thiamine-binding protein, partial [Staphylococcus epidermidis]|nr:MTH1187 family thiamine-binding protein [Staphylococcus epidermidis]
MAIVDVVVIPVGTEGPSVSKYIAEIQTKLNEFKQQGKIDYQLTPMNTLIEGDLKDLFEVIQAIHELPFDKGLDRVCTNIRIDDRLIHGQVATMWSNKLGVTRLMVVNDNVAKNDLQKQVLRMAVPAGISSSIITEETAISNIKNGKYEGQNVLMIVKSPVDLLPFIENDLEIKRINVGNMSNRNNTTVLRPNISVTDEE